MRSEIDEDYLSRHPVSKDRIVNLLNQSRQNNEEGNTYLAKRAIIFLLAREAKKNYICKIKPEIMAEHTIGGLSVDYRNPIIPKDHRGRIYL